MASIVSGSIKVGLCKNGEELVGRYDFIYGFGGLPAGILLLFC